MVKSASRIPEGDASSTPPGTPAETSAPDSGKSDGELIDMARKSLMEAVLQTTTALANGAKQGSVPHIKLLLQLVGLDEAGFAPVVVRPKEKTLEEIVMEQWNREP